MLKQPIRIYSALIVLMLISSCGGVTTVETTSTPTTTTVVLDPIVSYEELKKSVQAKNSSEIVENQLEKFALVIADIPGSKNPQYDESGLLPGFETQRSLTLYMWKNNSWVDVSSPDTSVNVNDGACDITTKDFNDDGVKDFLVDFCGFENGWGKVLVSSSKNWQWARFEYPPGPYISNELQDGADGLDFDVERGVLTGEIVEDHTPLVWSWDKSTGLFTAVEGIRPF